MTTPESPRPFGSPAPHGPSGTPSTPSASGAPNAPAGHEPDPYSYHSPYWVPPQPYGRYGEPFHPQGLPP
ncbi:MAG: hypothetical protein ACTHMS_02650, partial [Jatrophihabitans sp.]